MVQVVLPTRSTVGLPNNLEAALRHALLLHAKLPHRCADMQPGTQQVAGNTRAGVHGAAL